MPVPSRHQQETFRQSLTVYCIAQTYFATLQTVWESPVAAQTVLAPSQFVLESLHVPIGLGDCLGVSGWCPDSLGIVADCLRVYSWCTDGLVEFLAPSWGLLQVP
ncbi:hypothetical protein DPMN_100250 [Dreissena polymorpha]|uniref:Uncharacterized protein n=1 Tax=Dreissena polymorpha TaxID=45954 RepID=A0A9D4R7A3_DREPO|nr:hypothetical protein DPMN_100250 [Dreissena polymorpha]